MMGYSGRWSRDTFSQNEKKVCVLQTGRENSIWEMLHQSKYTLCSLVWRALKYNYQWSIAECSWWSFILLLSHNSLLSHMKWIKFLALFSNTFWCKISLVNQQKLSILFVVGCQLIQFLLSWILECLFLKCFRINSRLEQEHFGWSHNS